MICIAKYRRTNNNDRHDIISILNTDKERPISLSVWKTIRNPVCHGFEQTHDAEDVRQLRIEENLTSIGRAGEETAISLSVTVVETMLRQHSFLQSSTS